MYPLRPCSILIWTLLFIACRDKPDDVILPSAPQLPEATQTGANTFGCLVNGEVWLPSPKGNIFLDYGSGSLISLYKDNRLEIDGSVKLNVYDQVFSIGDYTLSSLSENRSVGSFKSHSAIFTTDSTHIGKLTITRFDTLNYIISGTFWFDGYHEPSDSVVQIREGRFDVKYNP